MDLIYMDSDRVELGVIPTYELDLAFGADENNFECTIPASGHCCGKDYYLCVDGTEYGGIIDTVESDTRNGEVTYSGRTWQGILASRIILPLRGTFEAATEIVTVKTTDASGDLLCDRYLVISGDVNRCIQFVVKRCGLSALFTVSEHDFGVTVSEFQFNRYTDAYAGLVKMLESVGLKMTFECTDAKVLLVVKKIYKSTEDEQFDTEQVDFTAKKNLNTVNHLICLGSGEMENRMVIHLYADRNGKISEKQTIDGLDEYVAVYDYPNVESKDELRSGGKERLKELIGQDEMDIDFDAEDDSYSIGDMISASDHVTGISVVAKITKKIVKIKYGIPTITYKVGG